MSQTDGEIVSVGKKKRKNIFGILFEEICIKNFNEMKNTFVDEVLIPQTMDWLYDLGTDFLSGILQSSKSSSKRSGSSLFGRTDYSSRFHGNTHGKRERRDEREENVRDYEEISFDTRPDAERILMKMMAAIERYQIVAVSDLLSWSGFKTSWTDEKFGWTDLSKAKVYRVNGRYYLDLPEPHAIEED